MSNPELEKIKKFLADNRIEDDVFDGKKAEKMLGEILERGKASRGEQSYAELRNSVEIFIGKGEIAKRKLLSYCLNFCRPAQNRTTGGADFAGGSLNETVVLHKYLDADEFTKICGFVNNHKDDKTFGDTVYEMIAKRRTSAPAVYKASMLRRQDFSRAVDPYAKNISRPIVWQIILGLKCNLEEADELLFSAGYIRRQSDFDLVMVYFIRHGNYDVMAINDVLYELGLKPFSCHKDVRDSDSL